MPRKTATIPTKARPEQSHKSGMSTVLQECRRNVDGAAGEHLQVLAEFVAGVGEGEKTCGHVPEVQSSCWPPLA